MTATDDHHLAAREDEPGEVGVGVGHVPIVPFPRVEAVARFGV